MSELKRFVPGISNDVGVTMLAHDYGGYVEYARASAAIEGLTTELSVAKKWGEELQRSFTDAQAAAIQHADRADQNERERIIAQDRLDREQAENAVLRERLAERYAEIERLKGQVVAWECNAIKHGWSELAAENLRLREALTRIMNHKEGSAQWLYETARRAPHRDAQKQQRNLDDDYLYETDMRDCGDK